MKIAKYETKRSIICPTCDKSTGSNADHLIAGGKSTSFGPWTCGACGTGYKGTVDAMGQVFVEAVPENKEHKLMALLVLPPQTEPVYFLLPTKTWTDARKPEVDLDKEYYFNEHSCPTNWLGNVERIQIGDDADPHGLLRFVRAILEEDFKRIEGQVRVVRGYTAERNASDSDTDRVVLETAFPEVRNRFVPTDDFFAECVEAPQPYAPKQPYVTVAFTGVIKGKKE